MQNLDTLLAPFVLANVDGGAVDWNDLKDKILDREDEMSTELHVAGAQFGVHPQIAAEVFASIGVGHPLSEEQRAYIRAQFVEHMNQLRAQYEAMQRGEEPPAPDQPNT